jgi:hypothetical protein
MKLAQVSFARCRAGSTPAALRISHTVDAATVMPSSVSSPWMRRVAPIWVLASQS